MAFCVFGLLVVAVDLHVYLGWLVVMMMMMRFLACRFWRTWWWCCLSFGFCLDWVL